MEYKIVNLSQKPEILDRAARWFHEKWEVPLEAYRESMEESLLKKAPVPQWYLALKDSEIIGGMGVIENDFHHRKDLAPNVCAVYTEAEYRNHGVAGALLDYVCRDMKEKESIPYILLQTILPFTKDMAGNFTAWFRATESLKCQECISTEGDSLSR